MYSTDQSILVEAVEQLLVSSEIKSQALNGLREATDKLKQDPYSQRNHMLLFINNKLLSLLSSRQSQPLSPSDLLFINIFQATILHNIQELRFIQSHLIFLEGSLNNIGGRCIPCIIHSVKIHENITFVILIEFGSLSISRNLYEIFFVVQEIKNMQLQSDLDNLKQTFESLDLHVKHATEGFKKVKHNPANTEDILKTFSNRWDTLKKRYLEFFKTSNKDVMLNIESNLPMFIDSLRILFEVSLIETI